ncbi:MAG TPA: HAD family hydrolase [Roseiarcus sp.]|nr:HAD family hydrolase [Roseiarcus sp.]
MPIDLICLDADDTLWGHESFFQDAARRYCELLAPFADRRDIETRLCEAEDRNLHIYGYGVKGFTLSMMETALEIAGEALPAAIVKQLLDIGRDLMRHPIALLPSVKETLPRLAARGRLVLVTKGDLFHQESKLAASGLGEHFDGVEIVSEKTAATYARIFARYGAAPRSAVMAGNSLRSDVWPALAAGAFAVHIPHEVEWAHERAETPQGEPRFARLAALAELPEWLARR